MIEIPANFPLKNIKEICQCGTGENMKHLYTCEYLSNDSENDKPIFEKYSKRTLLNEGK